MTQLRRIARSISNKETKCDGFAYLHCIKVANSTLLTEGVNTIRDKNFTVDDSQFQTLLTG